jgi:hypothetical protein
MRRRTLRINGALRRRTSAHCNETASSSCCFSADTEPAGLPAVGSPPCDPFSWFSYSCWGSPRRRTRRGGGRFLARSRARSSTAPTPSGRAGTAGSISPLVWALGCARRARAASRRPAQASSRSAAARGASPTCPWRPCPCAAARSWRRAPQSARSERPPATRACTSASAGPASASAMWTRCASYTRRHRHRFPMLGL